MVWGFIEATILLNALWICNAADCGVEFSIQVHHGGFFVGSRHLRTYVDGKISWFDHCDADTWSPLWFDDFIDKLGYMKTCLVKVYWLLPGKDLFDGLRIIDSDADTNVMCSILDRVEDMVVYIDHEDIVASGPWDVVVANPQAELPKVFSPTKVQFVEKKSHEHLPDFYKNLDKGIDHQSEAQASIGSALSSATDSEAEDFVDTE